MTDQIIRALNIKGGIRVLACSTTALAGEICSLQQASATASIALGRGIAAGALMGGLLKDGQRVALKFEGNGPLQKMIIEADYDGSIRATVGNPFAEAEPVNGRWNVPEIIGKAGFLTVSKDIGIGGEPYRGTVQLCTSEIGDDLAYYLTDSEQTPSAIGVGAALENSGAIAICGGFLVQALPGADESELDSIMQTISNLPPLCNIIRDEGVKALINRIFANTPYTLLETKELNFRCTCSRDKVIQALRTFTSTDLILMINEDSGAKVTCEFCRKQHQISVKELQILIDEERTIS